MYIYIGCLNRSIYYTLARASSHSRYISAKVCQMPNETERKKRNLFYRTREKAALSAGKGSRASDLSSAKVYPARCADEKCMRSYSFCRANKGPPPRVCTVVHHAKVVNHVEINTSRSFRPDVSSDRNGRY